MLRVIQVLKVQEDPREHRAPKEQRVTQVRKVQEDPKELKGLKEL